MRGVVEGRTAPPGAVEVLEVLALVRERAAVAAVLLHEGQLLRIPIPPLNEERRAELAKLAGSYAENARVAVRNVRRDGMDGLKKLEKDGTLSEDEHKSFAEDVQKLTDDAIKTIDENLKTKQEEIMQV